MEKKIKIVKERRGNWHSREKRVLEKAKSPSVNCWGESITVSVLEWGEWWGRERDHSSR